LIFASSHFIVQSIQIFLFYAFLFIVKLTLKNIQSNKIKMETDKNFKDKHKHKHTHTQFIINKTLSTESKRMQKKSLTFLI